MGTPREVEVRSSARVHVRAPIERVYATWVDPDLMPEWMGGHPITVTSGPLDSPGATFREEIAGPYRPRSHVIAANPPVFHEMAGRGIFGLGFRWTTSFAEVPDGTDVTLEAAVILPLHPLGRAVRRLLKPVTIGSRIETRLASFAGSVERGLRDDAAQHNEEEASGGLA